MKEEAKRQESETGEDTYRPNSDDITDWLDKADDNTVVYIDAGDGGTINWQINKPGGGFGCSETDTLKGTLVIDGANLKATGNKKSFSGVTIVRGGVVEGGEFEGGNLCWDGFITADGGITLSGTPEPYASEEVQDRPGFYGVQQWSWRECYSEDC